MLEFFTHFVEQYGYIAVALLVALEGCGVPLPGEAALVTAAAFAARGSLDVFGVVAAASIGSVVGGSGGYWIGRAGGRGLLLRYGHLLRMTPEKLARTEQYFHAHGAKTVFLARFVALLRIFGCLMAGVAHMPFAKFSVVNLAGGVVWASAFSTLGFVFGRNLPLLEKYIQQFTIAVTVIVLAGIAVYFVRRSRQGNA